jgi:hypothetical protein
MQVPFHEHMGCDDFAWLLSSHVLKLLPRVVELGKFSLIDSSCGSFGLQHINLAFLAIILSTSYSHIKAPLFSFDIM